VAEELGVVEEPAGVVVPDPVPPRSPAVPARAVRGAD
jgi:hypothetical protein